MRPYTQKENENFEGFLGEVFGAVLGGFLEGFLGRFSRLYGISYVSGLMIRFDDHTLIKPNHHINTLA